MATRTFRSLAVPTVPEGMQATTLGVRNNVVTSLAGDFATQSTLVGGPFPTLSAAASPTPESAQYKLRGYNTSTHAFEVWVSSDPYSSPPSLAVLIDITYSEFNT